MAAARDRWVPIAIAGVVVSILGVVVGPIVSETLSGHRDSEREVADFVGRLRLGLQPAAIERIEQAAAYRKIHATSRVASTWYYDTPPAFGRDNWVVTLTFDEEGLACAAVGTGADTARTPAGAPDAPCREGQPRPPRRPKPVD